MRPYRSSFPKLLKLYTSRPSAFQPAAKFNKVLLVLQLGHTCSALLRLVEDDTPEVVEGGESRVSNLFFSVKFQFLGCFSVWFSWSPLTPPFFFSLVSLSAKEHTLPLL